ncbi:MAG TPA: hypothetical protein VIX89_03425, partial [Bryobacteraceae bacterium]
RCRGSGWAVEKTGTFYLANNRNFLLGLDTGEVRGERPYSVWKIAMLVVVVLLVLWVLSVFLKR